MSEKSSECCEGDDCGVNVGWKSKYIGTIITIAVIISGILVGYGKLLESNEKNETQIEKVEIKVETQNLRINENENVNIEQSVIQERVATIVDRIELRQEKYHLK